MLAQRHVELRPDRLPGPIALELAEDVVDRRARRKAVTRQLAPGAAGSQQIERMAFIAARMSVLRGRPPGSAAGINGSSRAHSASVRSLGKRPRSRRYVFRCSSVHIPRHPAASNRRGESSFRLQHNDLLGQALSALQAARRSGRIGAPASKRLPVRRQKTGEIMRSIETCVPSARSLDHLVGAGNKYVRYVDANSLRRI
jgi:hypothetical protein